MMRIGHVRMTKCPWPEQKRYTVRNIQRNQIYAMEEEFFLGRLSRRDFLRRVAIIAGGGFLAVACGTGATAIPPAAAPGATSAAAPGATSTESGVNVSPDNPLIEAGPVEFQAGDATLLGYLSRPKTPGPHPAVLVVHENRGLLPHFPDITRRLAMVGYVALAVDMLSREGGTAALTGQDELRNALRAAPRERFAADGNSGVRYLQNLPYVQRERVGAIGFCFGGGIVWQMAVSNPELAAAVPFYGSSPPLDEVPNLRAPVLGIYAEDDNRINQRVPELEAALKVNGKEYQFVTFPGTRHAFFNDTGSRYHPRAAEEAWEDALSWLNDHLKN